jgi:hypothetical protein
MVCARIDADHQEITLGRHSKSDFHLCHTGASWKHARLLLGQQGLAIAGLLVNITMR